MAENTDIYETDENGEVVKNKDGSPRKKRGRKAPAKTEGANPDFVPKDEAEPEDEPSSASITELKTLQGDVVRRFIEGESFETGFLGRVIAELDTVFEKYGEQNRPYLAHHFKRFEYRNEERHYKAEYDFQTKNGGPTWDTIVLEEVYEALAATDPEDRIAELVQVAAMATLAAASLHRETQRVIA